MAICAREEKGRHAVLVGLGDVLGLEDDGVRKVRLDGTHDTGHLLLVPRTIVLTAPLQRLLEREVAPLLVPTEPLEEKPNESGAQ